MGRSGAYTGVALGDVVVRDTGAYFIAPKRLSNEFEDTIGAEPETCASLAATGAGASLTEGFSAGLAAAVCLGVSAGFGAAAVARASGAGSLRLASITLGFAGGGAALAGASEPPMPTGTTATLGTRSSMRGRRRIIRRLSLIR